MRITELGLDAETSLQVRPSGELGAAIEGDRTARREGQGGEAGDQRLHDRSGVLRFFSRSVNWLTRSTTEAALNSAP